MDPWRVLAPGDRVEKLVERALVEAADEDRAAELFTLVRAGGVIAGQMVALSLGADPNRVQAMTAALMGGEPGER